MIDYWHHPVVRPSVTPCIVAFRVGVQSQSCTNVFLADKFLFVCSDLIATKRIGKKQVEENANVSYFET